MNSEILSDVLRAVRLDGAVFFEIEASTPWVAEAPATSVIASAVMPSVRHVMEYHAVIAGSCWASCVEDGATRERVRLGTGSVVVFPRGDRHVISSDPDLRATPDLTLYRRPMHNERLPFLLRQGGGGDETARLVCGFLGCVAQPFEPLLRALPRMLHIPNVAPMKHDWLWTLIEATLAESRSQRVGSSSVLAKLSELIFIEVVRRYAEDLPPGTGSWLAGIADIQIGRALRGIHAQPSRAWTLEALAREAGLSRSALAERFVSTLGVPPMSYIQSWRMQIAEGLLVGGSATIGQIAAQVGYESEGAFSRAFRRKTGVSPAVRRQMRRRPA
jgi:AraC-like DNA-binding protein